MEIVSNRTHRLALQMICAQSASSNERRHHTFTLFIPIGPAMNTEPVPPSFLFCTRSLPELKATTVPYCLAGEFGRHAIWFRRGGEWHLPGLLPAFSSLEIWVGHWLSQWPLNLAAVDWSNRLVREQGVNTSRSGQGLEWRRGTIPSLLWVPWWWQDINQPRTGCERFQDRIKGYPGSSGIDACLRLLGPQERGAVVLAGGEGMSSPFRAWHEGWFSERSALQASEKDWPLKRRSTHKSQVASPSSPSRG